jgi:hypothetical protein
VASSVEAGANRSAHKTLMRLKRDGLCSVRLQERSVGAREGSTLQSHRASRGNSTQRKGCLRLRARLAHQVHHAGIGSAISHTGA